MLLKEDLEFTRLDNRSLMPVPKLSPQQVDDVVAFLWQDAPAGILPPWQPAPDLNVTFARLKQASNEPHNWLTYWGNYRGTHFTELSSITPSNVGALRSASACRLGGTRNETSPIVLGRPDVSSPVRSTTQQPWMRARGDPCGATGVGYRTTCTATAPSWEIAAWPSWEIASIWLRWT